ncbi:F0F1 ATP synthase subunit epsilon [Aurantimonas sp. A2-1-M11]|uniref:F0F1 ATP synthase subunit epsilon n=1 Tax=Aurantimonas sp. A2-1-M11 TaxID=3113712 RepID=UPI002F94286D
MADSFQFELVSPERLLLSEAVTAVNVPGAEGYFTVMAHHAPVMTTLKPGVVVATLEGGAEQRIFVRGGFADVNEAGFTLLAERATPVEELDSVELDSQIRDAEEDVADAETPEAKAKAQHALEQLREARSAIGV